MCACACTLVRARLCVHACACTSTLCVHASVRVHASAHARVRVCACVVRTQAVWAYRSNRSVAILVSRSGFPLVELCSPVRIRCRINPQFLFFNRGSADILTRIPFLRVWPGAPINKPHVAWHCAGWRAYTQVFSPESEGISVAPDKRHCRQWMSSLFYPWPVPLTLPAKNLYNDGFIYIVFDISPVRYLFDRVPVDNWPLLRRLANGLVVGKKDDRNKKKLAI